MSKDQRTQRKSNSKRNDKSPNVMTRSWKPKCQVVQREIIGAGITYEEVF